MNVEQFRNFMTHLEKFGINGGLTELVMLAGDAGCIPAESEIEHSSENCFGWSDSNDNTYLIIRTNDLVAYIEKSPGDREELGVMTRLCMQTTKDYRKNGCSWDAVIKKHYNRLLKKRKKVN